MTRQHRSSSLQMPSFLQSRGRNASRIRSIKDINSFSLEWVTSRDRTERLWKKVENCIRVQTLAHSIDRCRNITTTNFNVVLVLLKVAKIVLTHSGMDSPRPLKVSCGIRHQHLNSTSFKSWKLWGQVVMDYLFLHPADVWNWGLIKWELLIMFLKLFLRPPPSRNLLIFLLVPVIWSFIF